MPPGVELHGLPAAGRVLGQGIGSSIPTYSYQFGPWHQRYVPGQESYGSIASQGSGFSTQLPPTHSYWNAWRPLWQATVRVQVEAAPLHGGADA